MLSTTKLSLKTAAIPLTLALWLGQRAPDVGTDADLGQVGEQRPVARINHRQDKRASDQA